MIWQWSKTAATNATVDDTINWSEGMSPGSVNDSARAMMARIADWRDDTSGSITSAGTSSAYTVTSNSSFASLPIQGQNIAFVAHTTNAAAATLSVDGGPAYTIRIGGGSSVPAGALVAGTPYTASFDRNNNVWMLNGYYGNPFNVPLGVVLDYTGDTAPNSNFALANGQAISRTTYASYFALVGTRFGIGDGVNTFNIPDLCNRVVAGSQMAGTARITVAGGNFDGSVVGGTGGAQNHTLMITEIPVITPAGTISAYTPTGSVSVSTPSGSVSVSTPTGSVSTTINGQNSGVITSDSPSGPFATSAGGTAWGPVNGSTLTASSSFTGNAISASFTGSAASGSFTGDAASLSFTGSPFGSGAAHSIMPPTMVLSKIVRIF